MVGKPNGNRSSVGRRGSMGGGIEREGGMISLGELFDAQVLGSLIHILMYSVHLTGF